MKKLILLTLIISSLSSFAAPKRYTLASNSSNWSSTGTWAPVGIPADGDTVTIPENKKFTLATDLTLTNVFFDIYGTLELSGSNVKLLLKNASTLKIHTSGKITGTKNSQQLLMGNNIIFKGDDPMILGPVMATSTSNGFKPFVETTVLPVKFISFNVTRISGGALIQWTAEEDNVASRYDVERSNDGKTWTSVQSLNVTGNGTNSYSVTDKQVVVGNVYYRVKESDNDGTITFSTTHTLKSGTTAASITRVQNTVVVTLGSAAKQTVTVELISLNGTIAGKQTVSVSGSAQINNTLHGLYIVRVSNGRDLNLAQQLML